MVLATTSSFKAESYLTLGSDNDIPKNEDDFKKLINQEGIPTAVKQQLIDVFCASGSFEAPQSLPQYYEWVRFAIPGFKAPNLTTSHARKFAASHSAYTGKSSSEQSTETADQLVTLEDLNSMDSTEFETTFRGKPAFIQQWLASNGVDELVDEHHSPITAQDLSAMELDEFRSVLIQNNYSQETEFDEHRDVTIELSKPQFALQPAETDPNNQVEKMTAPVIESFQKTSSLIDELYQPDSTVEGIDTLTVRSFALYLAGEVADDVHPHGVSLSGDNLRKAMVGIDSSHGGVNAIYLERLFQEMQVDESHSLKDFIKGNARAFDAAYSKDYQGEAGININNGFSNMTQVPERLMRVARELLSRYPNLADGLKATQQESSYQSLLEGCQRTQDNLAEASDMLGKMNGDAGVTDWDEDEGALALLDYFPNPEAQAYLWSRIGVDPRCFELKSKPSWMTSEQWQLTQSIKEKMASRQDKQFYIAGLQTVMMAAFSVAAVFFPPVGFVLMGSGLAMSVADLSHESDIYTTTKAARSTTKTDTTADHVTLATDEDVDEVGDDVASAAVKIPIEAALMLIGMSAVGKAHATLDTGETAIRMAKQYGGTASMWRSAGKFAVSTADGTVEGALFPTVDGRNWKDEDTLITSIAMGAGFGFAGGALGHGAGMGGKHLQGRYVQTRGKIYLTFLAPDGTTVKTEIPRDSITWQTENENGTFKVGDTEFSINFNKEDGRFEIGVGEEIKPKNPIDKKNTIPLPSKPLVRGESEAIGQRKLERAAQANPDNNIVLIRNTETGEYATFTSDIADNATNPTLVMDGNVYIVRDLQGNIVSTSKTKPSNIPEGRTVDIATDSVSQRTDGERNPTQLPEGYEIVGNYKPKSNRPSTEDWLSVLDAADKNGSCQRIIATKDDEGIISITKITVIKNDDGSFKLDCSESQWRDDFVSTSDFFTQRRQSEKSHDLETRYDSSYLADEQETELHNARTTEHQGLQSISDLAAWRDLLAKTKWATPDDCAKLNLSDISALKLSQECLDLLSNFSNRDISRLKTILKSLIESGTDADVDKIASVLNRFIRGAKGISSDTIFNVRKSTTGEIEIRTIPEKYSKLSVLTDEELGSLESTLKRNAKVNARQIADHYKIPGNVTYSEKVPDGFVSENFPENVRANPISGVTERNWFAFQEAISSLLDQYGLPTDLIYAQGSRVTGKSRIDSDIDLGVYVDNATYLKLCQQRLASLSEGMAKKYSKNLGITESGSLDTSNESKKMAAFNIPKPNDSLANFEFALHRIADAFEIKLNLSVIPESSYYFEGTIRPFDEDIAVEQRMAGG